jgi:hypothetical protein
VPTRDQCRDERQTWRRGPGDNHVRPLVPHSRPADACERRYFARRTPALPLTRTVLLLRSNEVHRVSMSAKMIGQFTEKDARWCGIGREVLIQEKEAHAVNGSASRRSVRKQMRPVRDPRHMLCFFVAALRRS